MFIGFLKKMYTRPHFTDCKCEAGMGEQGEQRLKDLIGRQRTRGLCGFMRDSGQTCGSIRTALSAKLSPKGIRGTTLKNG